MGRPFSFSSLTNLSLAVLSLGLILKLCLVAWLSKFQGKDPTTFTYIGSDYPETWPIDVPKVILASEASHRYQMDLPESGAEWASLTPGDGTVYLGEEKIPYTISMMHQLRCMDILRRSVLEDRDQRATSQPSDLARHCLNYLKQMMLCRADPYIEPFQYDNSNDPVDVYSMATCRDWAAVHRAVKANQRTHETWRARKA